MKRSNLLRSVADLGLQLFETDEAQDANLTLADVVRSKEMRLWEGFPVLLVTSAERGLFDYREVARHLTRPSHKSHLASLTAMSLALYESLKLRFAWTDRTHSSLPKQAQQRVPRLRDKLKREADFKVGPYVMSSVRLKHTFAMYFRDTQTKLDQFVSLKEGYSLQYAMSQVFSPRQRELFLKQLKRERLSKTEREYYSRVVKKKVLALANAQLHRLACGLLK